MNRKFCVWRHMARLSAAIAVSSISLATVPATAAETDYPTKPVRVLVGFAAGGPADTLVRIVTQEMSATLGQSILIENKAGANSLIATHEVARAKPDGYTLLATTLAHNVNPTLSPKLTHYHPVNDFAPIALFATLPMIAVVGYNSPIQSIQDLIAFAKTGSGVATYGSAGNGGSAHLASALLDNRAGTSMTHVLYKGNAPALMDVISGNVTYMFYPMVGVRAQIDEKRLRAIAVTTPRRHPDFPDVPTMAEVGFTGFDEYTPGIGLAAPAGTDPAIVKKLSDAAREALEKPALQKRLVTLGAVSSPLAPAEFKAWMVRDYERWDRLIKAAGVKSE